MLTLLFGFLGSFLSAFLVIRFFNGILRHKSAKKRIGPQQIHAKLVPHVGGLAVFIGFCLTIPIASLNSFENALLLLTIMATSIPVLAIGIIEDIYHDIRKRIRIFVVCIGALASIYSLNMSITNLYIPFLDGALSLPIISILFTCFAITGLVNAYNLIDGINGLASMVGIISLIAIAYVAYSVEDNAIVILSLALIGSIAGFFVWNYPRGLIFLGDCGAYLIGFCIAVSSILIVNRNPQISPWFALTINIYPIFETLFTIWRRKTSQRNNDVFAHDALHLHSVIFQKFISKSNKVEVNLHYDNNYLLASRKTTHYLWLLSSAPILPGILWWDVTWILGLSVAIFCVSYCWIYKYLINISKPLYLKNVEDIVN